MVAINVPRLVDMPSFEGVSAGSVAICRPPANGRYHMLALHFADNGAALSAADTKTHIDEIRLKIDGKVQRVYSPSQLDALNSLWGAHYGIATGFCPIWFAEPWRRGAMGEDALSWGMADVSTFEVEVDIAAAGWTAPQVSMSAQKTTAPGPLGAIKKVRRFAVDVSATGIKELSTLPRGDGYLGVTADTDAISDIDITVDFDDVLREMTRTKLHGYLTARGLNPLAGFTHIPFDSRTRITDVLAMRDQKTNANDYRLKLNMTAAANFNLLTEILGPRD